MHFFNEKVSERVRLALNFTGCRCRIHFFEEKSGILKNSVQKLAFCFAVWIEASKWMQRKIINSDHSAHSY